MPGVNALMAVVRTAVLALPRVKPQITVVPKKKGLYIWQTKEIIMRYLAFRRMPPTKS